MTHNRWLCVLAILLLLGVAGWVWLGRKGSAEAQNGKRVEASPSATARTDDAASASRRPKRERPQSGEGTVIRQLMKGEFPDSELTAEQIERFLNLHGRTGENLVVASRLSRENGSDYLREAAEKFPDHPIVQLELAFKASDPDEQRKALDHFRKLDPNNALGDILSAALAFQQGDPEQAQKDLGEMASHSRYDSFTKTLGLQTEAAYGSVGFSQVDARTLGTFGVAMPEMFLIVKIGSDGVKARQDLATGGDVEGGERLAAAVLSASQRLQSESRTVVSELVGLSMEQKLLKASDPDEGWPDGRTTTQALADLNDRQQTLRTLSSDSNRILLSLSDEEITRYLAKARESGEQRALEDLMNGQK
ncbi:MAG: hypothetical protein QM755_13220 [Luteolibacter sp.]